MFEKSLTDLIRGIRANKENEHEYILKCIEEIRLELKTDDMDYKAAAISKLTYLQMMGYEFSWAAFHVVEIMSSTNLVYKRTGYLAASQSFRQETEVLMLATNLLKKDLTSPKFLEVGIAINGLSQFLTPELAQFLCQDLLNLLNHSKGYVRKRAVLALYKVFLKFPEGLRICFPKLKEKLDDTDPSVVTSVVNVICELSRKHAKNYLSLAPTLYKLLTTSNNNWMLIKIVKLFASLTPLEPRLIKKLIQPLKNLIETTPAMSLLYECIYTVITGGFLTVNSDSKLDASSQALASMCASKLKCFLEDQDQNLKYIGLLALEKMLPICPDLVVEHGALVLACVDDFDYSIRIRALQLITGMVTSNSLIGTVNKLMGHLVGEEVSNLESPVGVGSTNADPVQNSYNFAADSNYRRLVVESIVKMCSYRTYANVTNFEWYLATLVDLVYVSKVPVGSLLSEQILDVSVRVRSVRPYSVKMMARLISDTSLLENAKLPESNVEILKSAAWICGEYSNFLVTPIIYLNHLQHSGARHLEPETQIVYLQAIFKILSTYTSTLDLKTTEVVPSQLSTVLSQLLELLEQLSYSDHLELQERACNFYELLKLINLQLTEQPSTAHQLFVELGSLFQGYELNAVAPKAQSKIPVPEDLDLDSWINEPPTPVNLPSSTTINPFKSVPTSYYNEDDELFQELAGQPSPSDDTTQETVARNRRKAQRKQRVKNDPFYIGEISSEEDRNKIVEIDDVDSIPVVPLDLAPGVELAGKWLKTAQLESVRLGQSLRQSLKKRNKNKGNQQDTENKNAAPIVDVGELPEGVTLSDEDVSKPADTVQEPLLEVDLITPLKDNERLPQIEAYKDTTRINYATEPEKVKSKSKTKSKTKDSTKPKKKKDKTKVNDKLAQPLIDLGTAPSPQATNLEPAKAVKPKKSKSKRKVDTNPSPQPTNDDGLLGPIGDTDAKAASTQPKFGLNLELADKLDTLVDDASVQLSVTFEGSDEGSTTATFQLLNQSTNQDLEGIELVIDRNQQVQFQGLDLWNTVKLPNQLPPSRSDHIRLKIIPDDLNAVGSGIQVLGTLNYYQAGSVPAKRSANFELQVPTRAWMIPTTKLHATTPSEFENLVTTKASSFTEGKVTTISVPLPYSVPTDSLPDNFNQLLQDFIQPTFQLQTVENLQGKAASLFGCTIFGDPIVGLIKLQGSGMVSSLEIQIELKATNNFLLHGLIKDLNGKMGEITVKG